MNSLERSILESLAIYPAGKGALSVGRSRKKIAQALASKGWVEVSEGPGEMFVAAITESGRAAIGRIVLDSLPSPRPAGDDHDRRRDLGDR